MKLKVLILSTLISKVIFGQVFPINNSTQLISLKDSINLNSESEKHLKRALLSWGNTLTQKAYLERVFSPTSKNSETSVFFKNSFFTPSSEVEKNKYVVEGSVKYFGYKRDAIFKEVTSLDWTNGQTNFTLFYHIKDSQFVFEFTNFEYNGNGTEGKFEDDKPVKPFAIGVLAQNKKRWKAIKSDYFERIKILSTNLKESLSRYLNSYNIVVNNEDVTTSLISYKSYIKIVSGMSYDDVKRILGKEGKEQSSGEIRVDNKPIYQQVYNWTKFEQEKEKQITIVFYNKKVHSKSQINL